MSPLNFQISEYWKVFLVTLLLLSYPGWNYRVRSNCSPDRRVICAWPRMGRIYQSPPAHFERVWFVSKHQKKTCHNWEEKTEKEVKKNDSWDIAEMSWESGWEVGKFLAIEFFLEFSWRNWIRTNENPKQSETFQPHFDYCWLLLVTQKSIQFSLPTIPVLQQFKQLAQLPGTKPWNFPWCSLCHGNERTTLGVIWHFPFKSTFRLIFGNSSLKRKNKNNIELYQGWTNM